MNDPAPPPPEPEQVAEAARIRRRWLSLGEALAVAAVLISALTLWNSYSQRKSDEIALSKSEERALTAAETLLLRATPSEDGRTLAIVALRPEQVVQGQTIRFPPALGVSPVSTTGDARIEARWFDNALRKARKKAGRPAESVGDETLPVAITTRFLANGEARSDTAIYQIGYVTENGGFLQGGRVNLRGLSLIGRATEKGAEARIAKLWDVK